MKDKPVTRGPLSPIWSAWDSSVPRRPAKKKTAPIFTEQRGLARLDAMRLEDRERIRAEAVAYAAEQMRRFEEGRR